MSISECVERANNLLKEESVLLHAAGKGTLDDDPCYLAASIIADLMHYYDAEHMTEDDFDLAIRRAKAWHRVEVTTPTEEPEACPSTQ
jgi:hypothetical protein